MTVRTWERRAAAGLAFFAMTQWLTGCHSDVGSPANVAAPVAPARPAPPPRPPTPAWHGHFTNWLSIENERYFGEALLTVDGVIRFVIHGPYDASGVRPSDRSGSIQFIGQFTVAGDAATGSGTMLGQRCSAANTHWFCGVVASAQLAINTGTREKLAGEIVFASALGEQTWPFDLRWVDDYYEDGASVDAIVGLYREPFTKVDADTELAASIDGNGALFFQSADTGCVGNGSFASHGDGAFSVYDVSLRIDNCAIEFDRLVGVYEGLATETSIHSAWACEYYYGRCDGVMLWVSSPPATPGPRSLALWLSPH